VFRVQVQVCPLFQVGVPSRNPLDHEEDAGQNSFTEGLSHTSESD